MGPGDGEEEDEDWLDEVADALADFGLFDEDTRDSLLASVRDAMSTAERPERPERLDRHDRPLVTVLPGGRADDEDPTPSDPPELRVVQGSADAGRFGSRRFARSRGEDRKVTVRVLKLGDDEPEDPFDLADEEEPLEDPMVGQIAVGAGPDVWQIIAHMRKYAVYRLHCDEGEFEAEVDGTPIPVAMGQSADVEGRVLRVRSTTTDPAFGRYYRILPN